MRQLCRFRQSVDINTTIFNYTVAGKWHYRYLDESIIEIRKKESIDEITSFKKACALANERWPYVAIGKKLFSSKQFLRIWWKNDFRYNDVYEHEFINAVSRSEYEVIALADFDIVTLAKYLPADEFLTLLSDKECLSDDVKVVRCNQCKYRSEYDTVDGLLYYCNVHECMTPRNGYCHSGEAGEAIRSVTGY